ncbi:alpha/beta-hydrolase [Schizopora paradoxa]|uniref:Alpha/beta-hydrolase n=1 Tax=Schizopora paradoxa TaxID=27342 RepID=A0A0H2SQ78_9AGAM|nr:alpha/beta-hydrolase [Schizopora paradoxa]
MSFQGFQSSHTDCPSGAKIFAYHRLTSVPQQNAATKPVIVLLHGYPQNSLMYKKFVDEIPSNWDVIVPDLPGYGLSSKPIRPEDNSLAHSKREWAKDVVHLVDALVSPSVPIIAFGHDRGGRVAYRLSLDFPKRVAGAAVLDIVPGIYVWDAMRLEKGHVETKRSHHWIFLSSPRPLPETMIGSNPEFYFNFTMSSWTGGKKPEDVPEWVKDSIAPFLDPATGKDKIAAACEDYRAGASLDIQDDIKSSINPQEQPKEVFQCPMLVMYSSHLQRRFNVEQVWTSISKPGTVTSIQIGDETTGHFLINEKQEETGQRFREWLAQFQ